MSPDGVIGVILVPLADKVVRADADVRPVDDLGRHGARFVQLVDEAAIHSHVEVEGSVDVDDRGEGPDAFELHRVSSLGEEEDRFMQMDQDAHDLAAVETALAGDVLADRIGRDAVMKLDARRVSLDSVDAFDHGSPQVFC
jgi:hypothetical protein